MQNILLGTYTRRESKGIYSISLDTDKKELTGLSLMAEESNPTYLAKSKKIIFTQSLKTMIKVVAVLILLTSPF